MAAVTMAKVWLVLGLSSALRAAQEGGEEISSAVRYTEEDVDCVSLKFVSSEPYDVSHIRKILTHYWETSIGFYDCEECDKNRWNCYWKYYTYFKKHNRFAVLQAHIDSKAKNDAMCATEGWQHWGEDDWRLTLSPKFCSPNSKFSSALREKMAKDARERCKATLCELAKSGEWKNTCFKSKKEASDLLKLFLLNVSIGKSTFRGT